MTPAETLAAARLNVVGPYVPARVEWLEGWCGPANVREVNDWFDGVVVGGGASAHLARVHRDGRPGRGTPSTALYDIAENVRLDLRRPEVQDHLVRCGAPEWARKLPAALWVWATSGKVPLVLREWTKGARKDVRGSSYDYTICNEQGWLVYVGGDGNEGPETGPEGMACADLANLRAGCVLAEPDGWLVPLPDGEIGFWPKETS